MTEYRFTLKFNFHDRVRVRLLISIGVSLNALLETVLAIRDPILQLSRSHAYSGSPLRSLG